MNTNSTLLRNKPDSGLNGWMPLYSGCVYQQVCHRSLKEDALIAVLAMVPQCVSIIAICLLITIQGLLEV